MIKNKKKSDINVKAFAETERDPVSLVDLKAVMRSIMDLKDDPEIKGENRTPTKDELNRRWNLIRK